MAHVKERTTRRGRVYDVCWGNRSYTAKTLEEALLARIAVERGEEPSRVLPDPITLGGFLDGWEARWKLGKAVKTVEAGRMARKHLAGLEPLRLSQVSAARVEDEIATIAARAPRAAEMALSHLQKALRSAQAREHKIDPRILDLRPPSYQRKEIRFLTWDEVLTLQSMVDSHVCRIVPVAALTGMRKGELFDLTDNRVHLDEPALARKRPRRDKLSPELLAAAASLGIDLGEAENPRRVQDTESTSSYIELLVTKTRRPRRVWLSDMAAHLLREQLVVREPNPKGLVFPTKEGHRLGSRFEGSYRESVKLAGLTGATFHSLRHTAASLMIAAGCNPLEIAEQLGHMRAGKPDATMIWQRYGWLYSGATQRAVRRLDKLVTAERKEATA